MTIEPLLKRTEGPPRTVFCPAAGQGWREPLLRSHTGERQRRFYPGRKKRGQHDELDDCACRETEGGSPSLSLHTSPKLISSATSPPSHQAQSILWGPAPNENHREQSRAVGTPAPTAAQGVLGVREFPITATRLKQRDVLFPPHRGRNTDPVFHR